jgi:hypothetical protein
MFSWVSGQLPAGGFGGSARSDFVRLQSVIFYECTVRFAMLRDTRARAFYGELEVAARMRQNIWLCVVFVTLLLVAVLLGVLYGGFGVPVQYKKGDHGFPPERCWRRAT